MKAYLIIGHDIDVDKITDFDSSYVIGVDRGSLFATKNNVKLDLAIGDFDSVTLDEYESIENYAKETVKLNPIKDKTDLYEAYDRCEKADEIVILGGIQGRRIEHFLSILSLVKYDARVSMLDNNSYIFSVIENEEVIDIPKRGYKYISFFANERSILTLEGFKYPLEDYTLDVFNQSLTVSNEILNMEGYLTLKKGSLLVIQSKEDHSYLI